MKATVYMCALLATGCLKVTPQPEVPHVIVVDEVTAPDIIIEEVPEPPPLVKTWLEGENLRLFLEEREKQETRCPENDENCPEEEHAQYRRTETRDSQASWGYAPHPYCQLYNW